LLLSSRIATRLCSRIHGPPARCHTSANFRLERGGRRKTGWSHLSYIFWADRGEETLINPGPGLWPIFGPRRAPGVGNGPGSTNSAGCTNNHPPQTNSKSHSWAVFLGPTANI
jgi:hypothetical protein